MTHSSIMDKYGIKFVYTACIHTPEHSRDIASFNTKIQHNLLKADRTGTTKCIYFIINTEVSKTFDGSGRESCCSEQVLFVAAVHILYRSAQNIGLIPTCNALAEINRFLLKRIAFQVIKTSLSFLLPCNTTDQW